MALNRKIEKSGNNSQEILDINFWYVVKIERENNQDGELVMKFNRKTDHAIKH